MGYLGHRLTQSGGGVSTFSINKPTECVEGGWIFVLLHSNGIPGTHTVTPRVSVGGAVDSNMVLVDELASSLVGSTLSHLYLYRRKVLAGEGGASGTSQFHFSSGGGARTFSGLAIAYDTELDGTDPIHTFSMSSDGGSTDSTIHVPNVETIENNQYVVRLGTQRAFANFSAIAGYDMRANYNPAVNFSLFWMDLLKANPGFTAADTVNSDTTGEHIGMSLVLNMAAPAAEVSTLAPDGVAAQTGYANASTANIANILGDPDTPGGTGFTAN